MARRTDKNQRDIVAGLRAMGATVQDLSQLGKGCPDLLVGFRGVNYLMEVKCGDADLNARESEWHRLWNGQVTIVRTLNQAIDVISEVDE